MTYIAELLINTELYDIIYYALIHDILRYDIS